ncbi:MAG TPA: molecular chaperone TorD family protein [Candidatus Acidoferrales bacterium]
MDSQNSDLAPLLARRDLWLLVSAGFVDPYHHERFALLKDADFRHRVQYAAELVTQECPEIELGRGEVSARKLMPVALFAALDAESESIERSYRVLFGLTISELCPPCGVEYEPNADVAYRAQQMADIAGFYRAFGLEVSGKRGERLDHIVVEAEFLYLLNAKEAAALSVGRGEQAEVCRTARKRFFAEHVGWWLPGFAQLLIKASQSDFYRRCAALTASLSAIERTSLGLTPFKGRVVANPTSEEAEAECSRCVANQIRP